MACSSSSSLWSTDNRATFKGFCEYLVLDMFGPKSTVIPQMQALLTNPRVLDPRVLDPRVLDTVVFGKAF